VARPLDPRHASQLEVLRAWARLLDNRFQVPGTGLRFGLDPLIGLIPFVGDIATGLFSAAIVIQAFRMGIPKVVQARMVLNILIDVVCGEVPVVGDLFDFAWKSNAMNLDLLERHAYEVVRPSAGDWAFVVGVLAVIVASVAIPVLVLVWLIHAIEALRYL
jgi:hypothetical protein